MRARFFGHDAVRTDVEISSTFCFKFVCREFLLAAAVGGSLATAGAGYQALLRNPLAEPYLLGISNGAAVGTMIALVFFGANEWTRPVLAFTGALARHARGVSTGARACRRDAGAFDTRRSDRHDVSFVGDRFCNDFDGCDADSFVHVSGCWAIFRGRAKHFLPVAITIAIAGTLALTLHARSLNLLMLGERDAFDLGVEVGRVRIVVFVVASLLVGSSVAASGSVGYVGLVVPHLARLSLGSDNRISIPAAALGGALFVIVADTVARTIIAPRELPVGAITALIGAPLFIYLLKRA